MEYQSLYRRYRPGRFSEVRGQEHVIRALQNAVRDGRVAHAYLLSGPRGTGKTTLARILAKVLNCENVVDAEPCGICDSCRSVEAGNSFDLHELDAASNNKVDDMRDLLSKVALGTPGRSKVYLLDEVHMLSSGAENALLKTLEEPPDHVVFVLATTEPHKVVPTIRSRTQHLELTLLPADVMAEHVRWIANDAGLEIVDDEIVEYVVRAGGGSVRDTLSALDQVVAAGGIAHEDTATDELLGALADANAVVALTAIEEAMRIGRDPRVIGERLLDALRSVFLVAMGASASRLTERERERAESFASRLSPPVLTRALETIGTALVDMRQAPDPRIDLEVALVKLTRVGADSSIEALADRVARLERALASGVPAPAVSREAGVPPTSTRTAGVGAGTAPAAAPVPEASAPRPASNAAEARARIARPERPTPTRPARDAALAASAPASRPAPAPRASHAPDVPPATAPLASEAPATAPTPSRTGTSSREAPAPTDGPSTDAEPTETPATAETPRSAPTSGTVPTAAELNDSWSGVLDTMSGKARAILRPGKFVEGGDAAVLALPNESHRTRGETFKGELETALAARFTRSVAVRFVVDGGGPGSGGSDPGQPPLPDEPPDLVDDDVPGGSAPASAGGPRSSPARPLRSVPSRPSTPARPASTRPGPSRPSVVAPSTTAPSTTAPSAVATASEAAVTGAAPSVVSRPTTGRVPIERSRPSTGARVQRPGPRGASTNSAPSAAAAAKAAAAAADLTDEAIDPSELTDAPAAGSLIDQLTNAFPGAELLEDDR
jgi:DNA polymerase-3 subunit gamma/tau